MESHGEGIHCYCSTSTCEPCMLTCGKCKLKFHISCLKSRRPSDLAGDIYFKFTCVNCSTDGQESFERLKLQWTTVLTLSLYNLQLQGGGKCGYFRWREQICRFIDKNWATFFGSDKKKSATWHGTVAGCLSNGASKYFLSGGEVLGETGWWALRSQTLPTLEEVETTPCAKPNRRRKPDDMSSIVEGSRKRNASNVYEAALTLKERKSAVGEETRPKIKRKHSNPKSDIYPPKLKCIVPKEALQSGSSTNSPRGIPKIIIKTERSVSPMLLDEPSNQWLKGPDDMDLGIQDLPSMFDFPASLDSSNFNSLLEDVFSELSCDKYSVKSSPVRNESEEENSNSDKTGLSVKKGQHIDTSRKKKAVNKEESSIKEETDMFEPKYTLLSVYEEQQLLAKLENYQNAMKQIPEIKRLYRKLVVRKLKRERNIPMFDIDAEVRSIRGMDPPEYYERDNTNKRVNTTYSVNTILDRYQTNKRSKSQAHSSFMIKLMGIADEQQQSITSPYTKRILKPFIFRDYMTKPLKLQLLEEIVCKTNESNPDFIPPKRCPIDYCYVRPHHILTINDLCHQYFWPGIDLSDTLQYPDFSCVALYRKIVIGFAFMVPDVKYNEAYITFIFCHPEWRQAGIASFMVYHLIQTCMGKDITLHVSATNPAVHLYQRFGFKVEEFLHNYYDKYLPPESKECRHALFLRLKR